MKKITVTKTFLPPIKEYKAYLDSIWADDQITNQGPLLKEFEKKVGQFLGAENFHFVANGTLALQLSLRALGISSGEVITTPFTYVATTSAILWQGCKPVFADIDQGTLNIDPANIERLITKDTKAILPVHVFGNPCDVDAIELIAKKHSLPVIYDAAHGFGVTYKGKSLLRFGDISACSFHATKPFHTIEGGCVIAKDKAVSEKLELIKRFGHNGDEHFMLGINAKATEFQAAMGLCNLKYVKKIIGSRKAVAKLYDELLNDQLQRPTTSAEGYNYAYYPVIFHNEAQRETAIKKLNAKNIFPRRYFYPSLNTLPYLDSSQSCPISEDIAKRILCLPMFDSLKSANIETICECLT